MKPAAAKAKGRTLCKETKECIHKHLPFLHDDDVKVTSSGAGGEDISLSKAARDVLPFSVECKNRQRFSLWEAYNQAKDNAKGWEPIVVHRKNHTKPVVIVDLEYFIRLHADCDKLGKLLQNEQKNSRNTRYSSKTRR